MPSSIVIPEPVRSLCDILAQNGHEAYVVGGSVRDQLMGISPHDYDITTDCLPEKTMEIFKALGYPVIPVGLKFGTVTVLREATPYEITTYRQDHGYTDSRHPDRVSFVKSVRGDLERRDFTINALAYDPRSGELLDFFGGRDDLARKLIRAVGEPERRFAEDHLRMLRGVRYAARFGFNIESGTLAALQASAAGIKKISAERILAELLKMAGETGAVFARALELLKTAGLLAHILPEIDVFSGFAHEPDTHPEGGVWEHTLAAVRCNRRANAVLNLAILFHDAGKPAAFSRAEGRIRYFEHHDLGIEVIEQAARRLKMSTDLKAALQFTAAHHMKFHRFMDMSNHKAMQLIADPNWDVLFQTAYCDDASRGELFNRDYWGQINKRVADLRAEYIENEKWAQVRKVVNGEWVMKIKNLRPGPELGDIIEKTIEWILNQSIDLKDTAAIEQFIRSL